MPFAAWMSVPARAKLPPLMIVEPPTSPSFSSKENAQTLLQPL